MKSSNLQKQPPNMTDYEKEYREFSLQVPERFSFPIDVFDKWENRLALFWTDGSTEIKLTFNELKILSSKGAGAFKNMGINKGDKVLVMLPNIPEWWEIMLGLMRLNAIPIPATTLLTAKDIRYRLSAADIKAIIAADEEAPKIEEAVDMQGHAPILIIINPSVSPLTKGGIEGWCERQGWHNYIKERNKADANTGKRALSDEP